MTSRVRTLAPLISAVAVALLAIAATLPSAGPAAHAGAAGTPSITLVHQAFALTANDTLQIQMHVDPAITADSQITVSVYQKVIKRKDFTLAKQHHFGQLLDSVTIDPTTVSTADDGSATISIPTESNSATAPSLRLPTAGVYPVLVTVQTAGGTGELITFVDRMPTDAEPSSGTLGVAVVASVTAPPAVPGYGTPIPADIVRQITDLLAYQPAGADAAIPLTVSLSPELLGRLTPDQLDQLHDLLNNNATLDLSQPQIPLDPSVAAASDLEDKFKSLLVNGEHTISDLGVPLPDRSAWLATTPITSAGLSMVGDLGAHIVTITTPSYRSADGTKGGSTDVAVDNGYSDFSQLVNVVLPDDTTLPGAVIDPDISAQLSNANPSMLDQLYLAAELVTWRDQLADALSPVDGHSIVLEINGGGVPNPALVRGMRDLTAPTEAITFTDLQGLARETTVQNIDGQTTQITLQTPPAADLTSRIRQLDLMRLRAAHVGTMLVENLDRRTTWGSVLDALTSSSITDQEVSSALGNLAVQLDKITGAIVPHVSYGFTLSGLKTDIPIRIENTSDEPLKVLIRLTAGAAKLTFPNRDQPVELEPGKVTPEQVRVNARANGSSTVTLTVSTADGALPVVKPVILQMTVRQLTGLAQLLTGAGVLILATWWVRNYRRSRRERRLAAIEVIDHPSTPRAARADRDRVRRGSGPAAPDDGSASLADS